MPRRPQRGRGNRGEGTAGGATPITAPTVTYSTTTPGVTAIEAGATVTSDVGITLVSGSAITTYAIGAITLSSGAGWCTAAFVTVSGSTYVRLTVDPTNLDAGTDYTASVPVTLGNAAGSTTTTLTLGVFVSNPRFMTILGGAVADFTATEGTNQTQTPLSFTISEGSGIPALAGPTFGSITYTGGFVNWITTTGPTDNGDGTYAMTVTVDSNGIPAGTHAGTFVISDANCDTTLTFTVNLTVAAAVPVPAMSLSATTSFMQAVEGDATTDTDQILVTNSANGTLATISATIVGGAAWLTVTVTGGGNAQQINLSAAVGALAAGTYTDTVRLTSAGASNNPQDIAVIFDVSPAATAPVLAVSPSALTFSTVEAGSNPASKTFTATNVGTGALAGPTATEAASWLTVTRTGSGPYTFTCAVNNTGLTNAASPYTANITVSDTANTGTDQTVAVTVNVAAAPPAGTYPNLPYALPVGMTFNTTTNLPEGTPLQIQYKNTPQATLVNMEVTADSLGRTLGTNATTNLSILQRWLNDDATTGTRRGYTFNAGRQFLGRLVIPHNAGAGWTLLKPNGYTYDSTLATPPTYNDPARATFTATGVNQPAISTSQSGAADSNHGRFAIMGVHLTHDSTTGDTFLNVLAYGVLYFGHSNETTAAQKPLGFLVHDCSIGGVPGRYIGRAMWCEAGDLEIRAVMFDEVHRSWTNATDTGQIQDTQCLLGMTCWRWDCRYTVFHGGDECVNIGGGQSSINNYGPMHDFFFGWCEFSHSDEYLFNQSGTDGPYNHTSTDRWHAKNCFEAKTGIRGLHAFCRFTGITEPNNNQGYLLAMKSAVYGTNNPTQTVADWQFHGCWIDRGPAGLGTNAFESIPAGATGLPAARIYIGDTFSWMLNTVIAGKDFAQGARRPMWVHNGTQQLDGIMARHCSNFTDSTSQDGAIFAYNNSTPNCVTKDCFIPWLGNTILANDGVTTTTVGTQALNAMAPGPTWTFEYNTLVPKATAYPANYPQGMNNTAVTTIAGVGVVNMAAGNLRLSPASSYYAGGANDASDGWNRGVADPDMVYTQLAACPTILPSHPTVP